MGNWVCCYCDSKEIGDGRLGKRMFSGKSRVRHERLYCFAIRRVSLPMRKFRSLWMMIVAWER